MFKIILKPLLIKVEKIAPLAKLALFLREKMAPSRGTRLFIDIDAQKMDD